MDYILEYIREHLLEIDGDIEVNVTEEELKEAFTSEENFDVFIDVLFYRIARIIKETRDGKRES